MEVRQRVPSGKKRRRLALKEYRWVDMRRIGMGLRSSGEKSVLDTGPSLFEAETAA